MRLFMPLLFTPYSVLRSRRLVHPFIKNALNKIEVGITALLEIVI